MTSSGSTSFFSNALGGSKDNDDHRKSRFENLPNQNRYFELKHQRDAQRLEYIRQGVLPDPDKAQDLSAAKSLMGTCLEMCPEFEREEREFQNEGDVLEMFPGTSRIDPALAVKIYRRPAAGRELPLPEDVRPPHILRQTLDYLFHRLLPADPSSPHFTAVQPFMWNRTRAIRQDFIVQGLRGALEIECHERIARYHILCLHWKGGIGAEGWSEQQELEQLRKTIRSLTEFYEDYRRSTGRSSVNEAEFRAYSLLLHMQDPETLREVETLPLEVFDSPVVQAALRLRGYAQRSNNVVKRGRPLNTEATMNLWTRFFGEIKNCSHVSYLLACLAENAFSQVRAGAIKAMGKTYLSQHAPLPLAFVRRSLDMDTEEEARSFAVALNCEEVRFAGPDAPATAVRLAKANEDKPLPSAPFSKSIVEVKRGNHSSQDIVDGKLSEAAPLLSIDEAAMVSHHTVGPSKIPFINTQIAPPTIAAPILSSSIPSFFSSASTSSPFTTPQPPTSSFGSPLSANAQIFTPSAFSQSHKQANDTAKTTPAQLPTPSKAPVFVFGLPKAPVTPSPAVTSAIPFASGTDPKAAFTYDASDKKPESVAPQPMNVGVPAVKAKEVPPSKALAGTAPNSEKDIRAKPNPLPPARPARTVASVSSSLASSLIEEFLGLKLTSICQQACLREVRVRRKEARRRFINDAKEELYEAVEADVVDEAIAEVTSEAIADEYRIRSLEKLIVRKRRAAVDRVLERRRKAEAWMEIEQRVHEIESIKSVSEPQSIPSTKKKRNIEEVVIKNSKSVTKSRRIEPSSTAVTSLEVESLRAMMASAAQLLESPV